LRNSKFGVLKFELPNFQNTPTPNVQTPQLLKVSIITVNYNETEATCALLESVRRQAFRDLEVIVVDNASRENPASLLAERYPEAVFLRSDTNLGFAGGNNLALKIARGEFLFFVNNDAELASGCIEKLLQLFENQPNAGIASPLVCYFPPDGQAPAAPATVQYAGMTSVSPFTGRNHTIGNRVPDHGQFAQPQRTAYAHGAAMMLPRTVLDAVGPMWEGFFLYYEELDWCARIQRAGYEVWVEPRARVWHKESLSVGKMGPFKTFYLNRNRVLFMRRNFGGWRLAAFFGFLTLATLPKNALGYLLRGDFTNLRAFLRGIFVGARAAVR
jgi:GT2 family glycosyltransferase